MNAHARTSELDCDTCRCHHMYGREIYDRCWLPLIRWAAPPPPRHLQHHQSVTENRYLSAFACGGTVALVFSQCRINMHRHVQA